MNDVELPLHLQLQCIAEFIERELPLCRDDGVKRAGVSFVRDLEALAAKLDGGVIVSVEDARWMLGAMETDVEAFQSVQLHDDARRSSEVANRLRAAIAEREPHFLADAAAAAIQAAKPEVDRI